MRVIRDITVLPRASLLKAGFTAIVDATFLEYDQRRAFQQLANHMRVPYVILEFIAPAATLRQRIQERKHDISDADSTVLEYQLQHWKPLHEDELGYLIRVDTEKKINTASLVVDIQTTRTHGE